MVIRDRTANIIRERRKTECFPIVNRGFLWYNRLSNEQLNELDDWYQLWLDAPRTGVIPSLPKWVNDKLERGEEILL